MTKWERVHAAKAGDKRWCTACGEDRIDQRSRLGRCPTCRKMIKVIRHRQDARKQIKEHPISKEKSRAYSKTWRDKNPEKARQAERASQRKRV